VSAESICLFNKYTVAFLQQPKRPDFVCLCQAREPDSICQQNGDKTSNRNTRDSGSVGNGRINLDVQLDTVGELQTI
jgi:hypothetical protein